MGRISDTVKVLLIINVIFYIGSLSMKDYAYELFALWFPKNENFEVWQILTHMFMHGWTKPLGSLTSHMHILFNMFMLYMFGSHLENSIGQSKFIFLYFFSGLGAAGLQIAYNYFEYIPALQAHLDAGIGMDQVLDMIDSARATNSFYPLDGVDPDTTRSLVSAYAGSMVGASGAIAGVIMAFAVVYPNLPLYLFFIPVPIKAKYLIGAYFLIDLYGGITGNAILGPANTAHWAHVGGGIIGFVTMYYWKKNSFNKNRWDL